MEVLEQAASPKLLPAFRLSSEIESAIESAPAGRPSSARAMRGEGGYEEHKLESAARATNPNPNPNPNPMLESAARATRLLGYAFLIAQMERSGTVKAGAVKAGPEAAGDEGPDGNHSVVLHLPHLQLACRLLVKHAGAPAAGMAETLRWVVGCAQLIAIDCTVDCR